jgi:hypothetical protein
MLLADSSTTVQLEADAYIIATNTFCFWQASISNLLLDLIVENKSSNTLLDSQAFCVEKSFQDGQIFLQKRRPYIVDEFFYSLRSIDATSLKDHQENHKIKVVDSIN